MTVPDPIVWYDRRPVWVRIVLYPVLVPALIVCSIARVSVFMLVEFPIYTAIDILRSRERWRKLRSDGRLLSWSTARQRLAEGGMLIVGVGANGPGYTWVLDQSRDEIDPEHALPTWSEFRTLGWLVFEGPKGEAIERWAASHDAEFRGRVPVARATWWRVWRLDADAKARSVLVYC